MSYCNTVYMIGHTTEVRKDMVFGWCVCGQPINMLDASYLKVLRHHLPAYMPEEFLLCLDKEVSEQEAEAAVLEAARVRREALNKAREERRIAESRRYQTNPNAHPNREQLDGIIRKAVKVVEDTMEADLGYCQITRDSGFFSPLSTGGFTILEKHHSSDSGIRKTVTVGTYQDVLDYILRRYW